MQPRNAAILFFVAAALGAFVYLYEIQGGATRDAAERESRRMFPGVEPEGIAFMALRTRDDRAFEAVREGEGWLIQSPIAFAGDEVSLDAMASALANLETDAAIDDPAKPEVYGLGDNAGWVRFRVGGETFGLGLGADTPVGGNVYVGREGSDEVFTVPSFRVSSFDRELSDLRDKRVFGFDRTRVERIVVGWPEGSVTVERGADEGEWSIAHPAHAKGPADEATIDGLLSDLAFLRAADFVDPPNAEANAAIGGEAFITLRLGLEAAEGDPLEIGLRAVEDSDSDDFLVRAGEGTTLFKVSRGRLGELPREVFAYRFKQLSQFDVSDVKAFELEFADTSATSSVEPVRVRVERIETGWRAGGAEWRPGKAGGLMSELAKLEAISVLAEAGEEVSLGELGLEPPRVVVRAYGRREGEAAAPLLAEVALGRRDEGVGIVAQAAGQSAVYRIDEALADSFPVDLAAYEARFLAPPAPPPDDRVDEAP